jgi:hypothetical protein
MAFFAEMATFRSNSAVVFGVQGVRVLENLPGHLARALGTGSVSMQNEISNMSLSVFVSVSLAYRKPFPFSTLRRLLLRRCAPREGTALAPLENLEGSAVAERGACADYEKT